MKFRSLVVCLVTLTFVVVPPPAAAYEVVRVTDGGSIHGKVSYASPPPAAVKLVVDTDVEVCGKKEKYSKKLIVSSDGGIKNVVVNVRDIARGKNWTERHYTLGQHDCEFVPHVLLIVEGADLHLENSDRITHTVRSHAADSVFNVGQPRFVEKLLVPNFSRRASDHRVITLGCDIHKWMRSYVVVQDSPYFSLTGTDGAFELTDIPPGEYELEIWHATLGETRQKVTVKPNSKTTVAIELSAVEEE